MTVDDPKMIVEPETTASKNFLKVSNTANWTLQLGFRSLTTEKHERKNMRLHLYSSWFYTKKEANEAREWLKNNFNVADSDGLETINLTDHKEYRADITIETDNYRIAAK